MICFFASLIFPWNSMVWFSNVSTNGEITSRGSSRPRISFIKTASASYRSFRF